MTDMRWRKASYSQPNGGCVELSNLLSHVRDSKNPDGPVLRVKASALVEYVKRDR